MLSIWLCWMLFRSLYKMLLQETQHQGRRILAHLQLLEVKAVGEKMTETLTRRGSRVSLTRQLPPARLHIFPKNRTSMVVQKTLCDLQFHISTVGSFIAVNSILSYIIYQGQGRLVTRV